MRILLVAALALAALPARAQVLAPILSRSAAVPALSVPMAGNGFGVLPGLAGPRASLSAALTASLPSVSLPAPVLPAPALGRPAPAVRTALSRRVRAIGEQQGREAPVLSSLFDGGAGSGGRELANDASLIISGLPVWDPAGEIAPVRSSVDEALPALRAAVGERQAPDGSPLSLSKACCGWAAPELGFLLHEQGHEVEAVEAEFHVYLVKELPKGRLFIDPTIRQFFGGPLAPPEIPEVFVGTREQLHALFSKHRAAKSTGYDVRRIYFSEARVRPSLIRGVAASVRSILSQKGRLVPAGVLLTPFQDQELRGRRHLARFVAARSGR